ncbi:hypothetical protein J8F10_33510 [Gemmata sp. G18]|uniref:Uncharacterized protein n=1 Tax=Gemmata palustris TaxID=2822762 RepID=A0ABS5C2G2_9BACT|nr:hypothetical protein [Gemmata palustris]MBP3960171.1 hypothetical protein [Gemmata palustris]
MRADICASDDYDTRERLADAIRALGGAHEGEWDALGVGLHRFRFPEGELSVFIDAWFVDVAGPDELVQQVLQLISGHDDG